MEKKKKKRIKKLPKALTEQEVDKILFQINRKCPTGCRNYAIIETMFGAGLRVAEICNLSPADVKLSEREIVVQQGKGARDRVLYVYDRLAKALKAWEKMRPKSDYYFCTIAGNKVSDRYIREVCYRLSEKSGVYLQDGQEKRPASPHTFRHSFATDLLKKGFNLSQIQKLMGHSNLQTTAIYLSVFDKELKEKMINR